MFPRQFHCFQNDVHLDEERDFALIKSYVLMSDFLFFIFEVVEEEVGGHIDSQPH